MGQKRSLEPIIGNMVNNRSNSTPMACSKQPLYKSHHIPQGKSPKHWNEWLQLWWYRFGVETGIMELEPFERIVCCMLRTSSDL